jgi:predicted RNase H-like HicB family nuclease
MPRKPRDRTFTITAEWDPEAEVWVATSDDVPGLVTEDATIEGLLQSLKELVPELLRLNGLLGDEDVAPISLVARRQELVRLPH